MSEYFIVAAYIDNTDGEAYPIADCATTDPTAVIIKAFKWLVSFDHVCIFPYEYRNMFYEKKPYTKVLPYAISLDAGDKVNVNKLLTLLKIT